MWYKICTQHILEKNETAAICRCLEGLKLRSMLCPFIGGVCVCVCVCVYVYMWTDMMYYFELKEWCGFLQISMSLDANTLLDIVKKGS